MIEIKFQHDGSKDVRKSVTVDDLQGLAFDQIVLVAFNRGHHIHAKAEFVYLLRDGDTLTFLKGLASANEFHEISKALKALLPEDAHIDEIK